VPTLVTNGRNLNDWIKPVTNKELIFKTVNAGMPDDVELIPFYKAQNNRYNVYWNLVSKK
jgi:hypothetical protein